MEESKATGPLAGLRVLDIATIIAGPFAASLLSDYGADVLKVELPGDGDGARAFPPFKDGKSLWWKVINRNKRFVSLDLRKAEGAELFKKLLPDFDVLVENFRPGTLDGWGLTKEVLWAANPKLVILRVTGFGQTGPYSNRPGFARMFEAMGGLTYITGEADGEPMHPGYPIGDAIGGLFGAVGILTALLKRVQDKDAPGQEIDLSLTEATMKILEFIAIEHDQLGVVRERSGNANQYSAPAAAYRTKDNRWVTLAGSTNALFTRNCAAIGRSDVAADPRFSSNPARIEHSVELNKIFADWCAAHTLEQTLAAFEKAGGTLAPIYASDQIAADPHFIAREAITDVADGDFRSVRMQNVVPRFPQTPTRIRRTGGSLGEHNNAVFGDQLKLSQDERDRLAKLNII